MYFFLHVQLVMYVTENIIVKLSVSLAAIAVAMLAN